MLKIDNLKQSLDDFSNKIVSDAIDNLKKSNKVDTGKLKDSVKNLGAKVSKNSIEIKIAMLPYGSFVDKGVRGAGGVRKTTSEFKRTNNRGKIWKQKAKDSPFSFKEGIKPSVKHFIDWSKKRGLNPYAIREAVYRQGIAPNHFLSDAVKKNIDSLPKIIQEKFSLDVKNSIDFIIKTNFNK